MNPGGERNRIRAIFDLIAPRYDLANRLLSAGIDQRWRARLVGEIAIAPGGRALDLCCGTGDLALALARRGVPVVGVDLSRRMLALARDRIARNNMEAPVALVCGDAEALPFSDGVFAAVTIGFGIRNVVDPVRGLSEIARALASSGTVKVLEFALPQRWPLRPLYRFYLDHILPVLGGLIAGSLMSYRYLRDSIHTFPKDEAFLQHLATAGLAQGSYVPLSGGIAAIYSATK
jgi:demethylmenaquinone methyltransferase/2-methoxy-6-polyprenyl-1,4-benzoquinol methylase